MNRQELIPQQALPFLDQEESSVDRKKSNRKLTDLVVSAIAFEYGIPDKRHGERFSRHHKIETSRQYWSDLCYQWKRKRIDRFIIDPEYHIHE